MPEEVMAEIRAEWSVCTEVLVVSFEMMKPATSSVLLS